MKNSDGIVLILEAHVNRTSRKVRNGKFHLGIPLTAKPNLNGFNDLSSSTTPLVVQVSGTVVAVVFFLLCCPPLFLLVMSLVLFIIR